MQKSALLYRGLSILLGNQVREVSKNPLGLWTEANNPSRFLSAHQHTRHELLPIGDSLAVCHRIQVCPQVFSVANNQAAVREASQ